MEKLNFTEHPALIDELNAHTTELAVKISESINKAWLAKRLDITQPTLYRRLEDNRWKPEQVKQIQQLYNNLF